MIKYVLNNKKSVLIEMLYLRIVLWDLLKV